LGAAPAENARLPPRLRPPRTRFRRGPARSARRRPRRGSP
jgi:hypothetical protein